MNTQEILEMENVAKYKGSGWHFQSQRHSNARRLGRAGGNYATKGYYSTKKDFDKDGVKNKFDCRPFNPKKHKKGKIKSTFKKMFPVYEHIVIGRNDKRLIFYSQNKIKVGTKTANGKVISSKKIKKPNFRQRVGIVIQHPMY